RRVWPDQLVINLDEHLPVARWGDDALLNNNGRAFTPEQIDSFQGLPLLNGPERAKKRVMQNYQQFNRLLRRHGHEVARLEMSDRGSWFLTTRDGIAMLLGRDDVLDKVQRFMTIDRLMLAERRELRARVDLRYRNGMAVAWREPATVNGEAGAIRASKQGRRLTVGLATGTSQGAAPVGESGTDGEVEIGRIGSHAAAGA